jgi:CRISPR-associated protein Cas1
MGTEGTLAGKYWTEFSKAVPKEHDFCSRIDQYRRAMGSGDMVNTMLNYGYSLLESECLRAINSEVWCSSGFLHEMTPSKNSLAYDFQEPCQHQAIIGSYLCAPRLALSVISV